MHSKPRTEKEIEESERKSIKGIKMLYLITKSYQILFTNVNVIKNTKTQSTHASEDLI